MKKITFKLEFEYDDRDTEIELIKAVNDLIFDLGSWSMLESIWEEHKIETVDDCVYIDEDDEPEMISHQEARRRIENKED